MTHPLIRNPAGKFPIQTKLKIHLRIEWTRRLRHQPFAPIGILLANLVHLRTAAPPRTVVVPHNLNLAHIPERTAARHFLRRDRIGLTAMLSADLDDGLGSKHSLARRFCFHQNISHRLLDIRVFACLGGHFQDWRMRVLRRRDQHGIDILHGKQFFHVLHGPRSPAVITRIRGSGFLAVYLPQVADRNHLHVVAVL